MEISRATLDGWVMTVGQLLIPLIAAIRMELLCGGYIQADETPVDVQTHDGRGKNHQAYLWQYGRPGRQRGVRVSDGPGAGGAEAIPGRVSREYCRPTAISATRRWAGRRWCMWPAGRMRAEVCSRPMNWRPTETVAKEIVERIDDLFAIDRVAREKRIRFCRASSIAHRERPDRCSARSTRNWRPRSSKRCLPASWVRRWLTCSGFGRDWRAFSNTRKWN